MKFHIIIDHPWKGSFNYAVMDNFIEGILLYDHTYDILDLNKEEFNPVISEKELAGYSEGLVFDPKVVEYQDRLGKADHLVTIFPIWWNVMPARLKGWMDKVLLPGFAFSKGQNPNPMLTKIKGATVITTTGTPDEYHRREYNNAIYSILCKGTLEFCGIRPVEWLNFGDTGFVSREAHTHWLDLVKGYAANLFP